MKTDVFESLGVTHKDLIWTGWGLNAFIKINQKILFYKKYWMALVMLTLCSLVGGSKAHKGREEGEEDA